jgi:uncharacterized membrane protein
MPAKKNYLSIHGEEKASTDKALVRRIFIAQSLYAFGALLCFISSFLSIAFIIVVQLNYALGLFTSKKK